MKEERNFLYGFLRLIYKTILKILYKPKIIGIENLKINGPLILAGNHRHAFDPVVVMMSTKRVVHFLAKIEAFKGLHGKIFEKIGLIKVDRSKANPSAIIESEKVLNNGGVIGIFPEGTRNKTEQELLRFKRGAVALSQRTGAIIIPFAIKGTYKFRKNINIEFGKPINISKMGTTEANDYLRSEVLKLLRK